MGAPFTIRNVRHLEPAELDALAAILSECVAHGASVSFMHPLAPEKSRRFWQEVIAGVAKDDRVLLLAEDADGICGTVQLIRAQSENQPHRAELGKLLVPLRARRRGIAAALMAEAEKAAREWGKSLLVLDTATEEAAQLYERMGWVRVGAIKGYALLPQGGLCDTVVYYKEV